MKTIADLDRMIQETLDEYNNDVWRNETKLNKLRKKAAFYNDMRLYILHKPTEESIINQLNNAKQHLLIAEERLATTIGNIIKNVRISDFEKEKLINEAKNYHNST